MTGLAQTAASTVRTMAVGYHEPDQRWRVLCFTVRAAGLLMAEIGGPERVSQAFASFSHDFTKQSRPPNPSRRRRS